MQNLPRYSVQIRRRPPPLVAPPPARDNPFPIQHLVIDWARLTVKSQGSDTPRALLAYYYAILFTSKEFTNLPLFPLIIDSPNQQDQDEKNRNKIIKFIFENTPKDYQLILGTVDLHGFEYQGHTISPSTKLKLLNTEEYDEAYRAITPLLDKLHESLLTEEK